MPAYRQSLGQDAVDFAADAGLFLDPWQQRVLRGAMGVQRGGKWSARQVGLLVPRQNGKGSVLEARELYAMFVGDERLIIHSAHRYDTSQLHFARVMDLIEGNPDLDRHVQSVSKVIGKESITLKSKCQLKFKARTLSGSGRGFSCDLLVLDEAFLLPEQALAAMLPTLAARPNPQTWYTSSSGYPDSKALWRIVERGRSQADGLAYWEWGSPADVDPSDRSVWRLANPGRVTMEALEDDYAVFTPEDFAREHLGIWEAMENASLLPGWADCTDANSSATPQAFVIEVDPERTRATVGAAGVRDDGVMHVEVWERGRGIGWVIPKALQLSESFPNAVFGVDSGGPAADLGVELEEAGLRVTKLRSEDVASACAGMVDAVNEGAVAHGPQDDLSAAVAGARKKVWRDGGFSFGRRVSTVDIGPLVAVTLARHVALAQAPLDYVRVGFI